MSAPRRSSQVRRQGAGVGGGLPDERAGTASFSAIKGKTNRRPAGLQDRSLLLAKLSNRPVDVCV